MWLISKPVGGSGWYVNIFPKQISKNSSSHDSTECILCCAPYATWCFASQKTCHNFFIKLSSGIAAAAASAALQLATVSSYAGSPSSWPWLMLKLNNAWLTLMTTKEKSNSDNNSQTTAAKATGKKRVSKKPKQKNYHQEQRVTW